MWVCLGEHVLVWCIPAISASAKRPRWDLLDISPSRETSVKNVACFLNSHSLLLSSAEVVDYI